MNMLAVQGRGGIFGGGDEPPKPQTQPDDLFSDSIVRFLEVISEGPIVGFVDGAKSIAFQGTPLRNNDGSKNFDNIEWDIRLGTPDQDWMGGFPGPSSETGVNTLVEVDTGPVVRSTTVPELDAVNVTVRFPKLMETNPETGDVYGVSVSYSIEYKHNADVTWMPFTGSPFTTGGKTSAGFERQHYMLVRDVADTRVGPWNLRFTRLTPDHTTEPTIADTIMWESFTEIIEAKLRYPNTAYVGMEVPANSFPSGVPVRTFDVLGRIIRVPTNYDPIERSYTGIWDGTFKLAWSNCPPWCLFDMITNTRYGLGIPDEKVDTAILYTIAKYCDQLISDGQGNLIPRYTMNVQITRQQDAITLLNQMCSNFLGMIYYSSGGVSFSQDSPRETDIVVNATNVVDGNFEYQTNSYQDTPNVIIVAWKNPLLQDKGDVETVEEQQDIAKRTAVSTTYEAFGIREQFRARLMGRWALYSGFNDGEVVVYRAGLDHCDVMPGWVAKINDPMFDPVTSSGRILSSNGLGELVLDREIELEVAIDYTLLLMMPDKSLSSFTVLTGPGTVSTLQLNPAPPQAIEGALWGLASPSLEERLWRIVSRTMIDKMSFEIAAIRYHPDKYSIVEGTLAIDADEYINPQSLDLLPPREVTVEEYITTNAAGIVIPAVIISYLPAKDAKVLSYTTQIKDLDGIWQTLDPITASLTRTVLNTPLGTYNVRVRANGLMNTRSIWVYQDAFLFGLSGVPGDVQDFDITVLGDRAKFTWRLADDLITSFWEIRYTPLVAGGGWVASSVLQTGIKSNTIDLPLLSGTYFIKAVSYAGTYSDIEAVVITTLADAYKINVIDILSEHPTWLGDKTNVKVISNKLELVSGVDAYTKLMLHFEGADGSTTFLDDMGHVFTALGNAQLDTAIAPPFGTSSGLFDGAGDYIETPDHADFDLGSGDFTFDMRFNRQGGSGTRRILYGQGSPTATNLTSYVELNSANVVFAFVAPSTFVTGTTAITTAGDHHLAVVRTGNIIKLFVDGVQEGGDQAIVGAVPTSPNKFAIGRMGEYPLHYWNGTIKEFRFSAGIARWTANFTPPTEEYIGFPATGSYAWSDIYDLGEVYLCRVTPSLSAVGNKVTNNISGWLTLSSQTVLSGVAYGDWQATIMARFTNDDPFSVAPVPTWSPWAALTVSDRSFRGMELRIDMASVDPFLTPQITSATVTIDMPDRVESDKNLAIPAIGLDVLFNPPFKVLKGIAVDMQGLLASDTYEITAKDELGFTIQCFDNTATPTNRGSFDYVASGYGRVTPP